MKNNLINTTIVQNNTIFKNIENKNNLIKYIKDNGGNITTLNILDVQELADITIIKYNMLAMDKKDYYIYTINKLGYVENKLYKNSKE